MLTLLMITRRAGLKHVISSYVEGMSLDFNVSTSSNPKEISFETIHELVIIIDFRDDFDVAVDFLRDTIALDPGHKPLVIAIVGRSEHELERAFYLGADDVLIDGFSSLDLQPKIILAHRLLNQTKSAARFSKTLKRKEEENTQLRSLAYTDHITGLPNRSYLAQWFKELTEHSDNDPCFAVHVVDLDGFKQVNDAHGHRVGDALLKEVATRLRRASRRLDLVARVGGDEMVVVQLGAISEHDMAVYAQKISETFSEKFFAHNVEITVGGSIGSALYPDDGTTLSELMHKADTCMYVAKRQRARVIKAVPEASHDDHVQEKTACLIQTQENEVGFRTVMQLADGVFLGAYTLAPHHRMVSREASRRPYVESQNSVQARCLEAALKQSSAWQPDDQAPIFFTSISGDVLGDVNFLSGIRSRLLDLKAYPRACELVLVSPWNLVPTGVAKELRDMGFRIGACLNAENFSVGDLLRFPLDTIHVDLDLAVSNQNGLNNMLVEMAVAFGRHVHVRTVIHGAGSRDQLDLLRAIGVDAATGQYVSPLISQSKLDAVLRWSRSNERVPSV